MIRTCQHCGAQIECADGGLPEGWSMANERGRTDFLCRECSRINIRAIEGKLSEEYWA
jgi:hypothetical protein